MGQIRFPSWIAWITECGEESIKSNLTSLVLRIAKGSSIESTQIIGIKGFEPSMDFCCRALGFLAMYRRRKSIAHYDSTASLLYINQNGAADDNVGAVDVDLHIKS